jgi:DNA (cytosine-5)-methyltransferase 1
MAKGINSTLDEKQTPVLVQPIAIQDVRPIEKAQNGRGWNDDGTAYTVDTYATQGVAQAIAFHPTQTPISSTDGSTHALGCGSSDGQASVAVALPIPFDTTQITSPQNGNNPKSGDPCHTLAAGAHPPAIAQAIPLNSMNCFRSPDADASTGCGIGDEGEAMFTITKMHSHAVAYTTKLHNTQSNNAGKIFEERVTCLDANSPPPALLTAMQVRRMTPVECERLQGFPDGYTAIPWRKKPADQCPDGPRYKALGNSWAVPVVAWIGRRIQEALHAS